MKLFITATDCCRHEDDHKYTQREKYTIGVTVESFTEIFILHMQTKGDYFHLKTFLLIFISKDLTDFCWFWGDKSDDSLQKDAEILGFEGRVRKRTSSMQHVRVIYFPRTSDFAFRVSTGYGVPDPFVSFPLESRGWFLLLGAR